MTVEAELFDGTVLEFPDGTSPDVVKRVAKEQTAAKQKTPAYTPQTDAAKEFASFASGATQNPARGQYEALPEWQKPIVAAYDIGNKFTKGAANMVGLNIDEMAAGARSKVLGTDYNQELAELERQNRGSDNRAGGAGVAAEIAGNVALPVALGRSGATLTGRFGTSAMRGIPGVAARAALAVPEAALYGGLHAKANDEDVMQGAGVGAVLGPLGSVIGDGVSAGVSKVAGAFNKAPKQATAGEWKSKADDAFARMRQEGVIYTKQAFDDLENKLNTFLTKRAYWPDNQPGIKGGLAMMEDIKARGGNMTPDGLMALRQRFSGGYDPMNKTNNAMVREAINLIDDLLKNPKKGFVAASGDPSKAAQAFKDGMLASRNQHKLEDVEYLIGKGQRQGDRNIIDNANKRVKALLSDKLLDERSPMSRGWNAAEKAAIKKASSWTPGERFAHAMSGAAPQGKLTGAAHMVLGSANLATGNLPGLAAQAGGAALGWASGKLADSMARKSVTELTRLIANGGIPPAQVQNVVQRLSHAKREGLSRALMALGVGRSGNEAPAQ